LVLNLKRVCSHDNLNTFLKSTFYAVDKNCSLNSQKKDKNDDLEQDVKNHLEEENSKLNCPQEY
jgi:hypothetical protein